MVKSESASLREASLLPVFGGNDGDLHLSGSLESSASFEGVYSELKSSSSLWRETSIRDRAKLLRQLQALIVDSADEISLVVSRETGKSRQDALIEVFISVDLISHYLRHAKRWLRRKRIPRGIYFFKRYFVDQIPYGTVLVLGPWNYPFLLTLPHVVAALAAGNSVVLKPSEVTPQTGELVRKLFESVPALSKHMRVIQGGPEEGKGLVEAGPDLVFLTGSTSTGRKVSVAAAERLIPVVSELGGKDPMIVLEDADVEAAAKWGAWGAYFNAGQTCIAVERVYVMDSLYEQFVKAVTEESKRYMVGYTEAKASPFHIGPLTHQGQADTISKQLDDARARGAEILSGGTVSGRELQPTVLTNVDHSMSIIREESFAPVLPVIRVSSEEQAIEMANDSVYGLSASVWSGDIKRALRVAKRLEVGAVVINDTQAHYGVAELPFGGVKESGNGRIHGGQDLRQFTQSKAYAVGRPPSRFDLSALIRTPGRYSMVKGMLQILFARSVRAKLGGLRATISKE